MNNSSIKSFKCTYINKETQQQLKNDIQSSKNRINLSENIDLHSKALLHKIADEAYRTEIMGASFVNGFCKVIYSNTSRNGEVNNIDRIILEYFKDKSDVLCIAKVEENNDYWLVVEDIYSQSAYEYNDKYFDILNTLENGKYFDFKVISLEDYNDLLFFAPKILYKKEGVEFAD